MALGVLQVSWICLLLFHGSCASVTGYMRKDDKNIVEDDDPLPLGSGNQPANAGASASRASAARWPSWVKKSKAKSSLLDVEKLANARPVAWVQERPDQPLVFPLNKNQNTTPLPASTGSGSRPNSDWQVKPVGSGSHTGFNAGSNVGVDDSRLVYKYPSQGSGAPSGQGSPSQKPGGHDKVSQWYRLADSGLPPQQVKELVQPFRAISSRQSGYKPYEGSISRQQKVNSQLLLKKPRDGFAPPPPPPKHIIQLANAFQRYRQSYRMSRYDPDFDASQLEGFSGVGPAVQPADSQYFMKPQWVKT
ncbi:uncharacterized protein LOC130514912 [Takifugu flavidus]|uniref:uncharacterized protein LOC130514912 n=1 Tax=Takifugu flavidus TaxID=433684 RepID=UPI002544A5DA|nr:uncharacterized protein LOC130514912 [Takifugu flavidus]